MAETSLDYDYRSGYLAQRQSQRKDAKKENPSLPAALEAPPAESASPDWPVAKLIGEKLLAIKESILLGCEQEQAIEQMELLMEEVRLLAPADPQEQAQLKDEEAIDLFNQELCDDISALFAESQAA